MLKPLIWLALTGGFFVACNPAPEGKEAPSPETEEQAGGQRRNTNLARLYEESCSNCHGQRGEGGGGGTSSINTVEKFDQIHDKRFFDAIKNGVPEAGMAPFGDTLSDEEIWGLVVYMRELQARALRQEFGSPKAENGVYRSKRHNFKVETILETGLRTPWSIDWLPDGRMLVTNRPGGLYVVQNGKLGPEVAGVPKSVEIGQGGLMEVAVHPSYATNGWVYLTYTEPAGTGGRGGMTKVVRGKIRLSGEKAEWTDQELIYEAAQQYYSGAGVHFGSKIAFDGKGFLYFSVGERGTNMGAQDPATPFGKVMRVHEDGKIPSDNPFPNNPAWSYGHRNQQGLAFDSEGNLWDTEHGPRGGDEVNLIKKGANYGWPVVAFSINYQGTPFRTPWPKPDQKIEMPVFRWLPSIGASGLDLVTGSAFPNWKGDMVAGGLAGNNLDRFRLTGGKLVEREELLHGMGRVRDIKVHADGTVFVVLNGPDKIIRLVPAS